MKLLKNEIAINYRNLTLLSLALDISFIVIHSLLIVLFRYHEVWPMFYFNCGSVILYIVLPILLYKDLFSVFVQIMHLEVVIHMSLAVYFVGWTSGFQIAILGFNIFLFWAEYMATTLHLKKVHSLILCVISMLLYIGVEVAVHHHAPQYPMPEESAYLLRICWAAVVFVITIFFLQMFAYLASELQKQLAEEALHDKLTGLHNRYYMTDYLERIESGWLGIADIDDFKNINDIYGHNAGDYVLKILAELALNRRPEAEVCRWGGEEFLLVGSGEAFEWLDGFRRQVEEYPFRYDGRELHLTITIGAATYHEGETMEAWVDRADMKLYEGKKSGKNKVIV